MPQLWGAAGARGSHVHATRAAMPPFELGRELLGAPRPGSVGTPASRPEYTSILGFLGPSRHSARPVAKHFAGLSVLRTRRVVGLVACLVSRSSCLKNNLHHTLSTLRLELLFKWRLTACVALPVVPLTMHSFPLILWPHHRSSAT